MVQTRICPACQHYLNEAAAAVRLHETDMDKAIELNVTGYLNEESREELAPALAHSFTSAQAAWDKYRDHLIGHGWLTPESKVVRPWPGRMAR